ncbi:MAG: hypothetical protein L3J34_09135 [Flavobacteriaceae bacterium]|nr:hypothetical protein [Flavobacteriaceae bacterium]
MVGILNELGFSKTKITDQTDQPVEFLENLFEKIKLNGPPKLSLNVLMGAATKEKLGNILNGLNEGRIGLQSGIYKK